MLTKSTWRDTGGECERHCEGVSGDRCAVGGTNDHVEIGGGTVERDGEEGLVGDRRGREGGSEMVDCVRCGGRVARCKECRGGGE